MKATNIKSWSKYLRPEEWPVGALEQMDAHLFIDCIFPLRKKSGVPMSPSPILAAHIRNDDSGSQHNTHNGERLSTATDIQVSSVERMIKLMNHAESIPEIGGIGIYFDTHKPTIHIDSRKGRLVWLAYKENGKRVYLYRERDYLLFYKKLGELLKCSE